MFPFFLVLLLFRSPKQDFWTNNISPVVGRSLEKPQFGEFNSEWSPKRFSSTFCHVNCLEEAESFEISISTNHSEVSKVDSSNPCWSLLHLDYQLPTLSDKSLSHFTKKKKNKNNKKTARKSFLKETAFKEPDQNWFFANRFKDSSLRSNTVSRNRIPTKGYTSRV